MAVLTLAVEKLFTDTRRLREAKRRAAALNKMANSLPPESPRRTAMQRLAAPVPLRTLAAAMVPVGILLGPMVMPFFWLKERVDPAVCSAPAGSAVSVVAVVDGDWNEPIRLSMPPEVAVDEGTPAVRSLPPVRKTLERLLALYRQPRNDPSLPWELRAVPDFAREQAADNLQSYLAASLPAQSVAWTLRPPDGMSGRFPVTLTASGYPPITALIVLGEDYPPVRLCTKNASKSPLKELRVVYPKPKVERVFWRPFGWLAAGHPIAFAQRLATIDLGWLMLYLAVYLPILMAGKRLLT